MISNFEKWEGFSCKYQNFKWDPRAKPFGGTDNILTVTIINPIQKLFSFKIILKKDFPICHSLNTIYTPRAVWRVEKCDKVEWRKQKVEFQ